MGRRGSSSGVRGQATDRRGAAGPPDQNPPPDTRPPPDQNPPPGREPPPASQPPSGGSSDAFGTIALLFIGIVLVFVLVGANASIAADRTVLDADHTISKLEEEGAFATMAESFRQEIRGRLLLAAGPVQSVPGIGLGAFDTEEIEETSVTDEYVRDEMGANIRRLYAFLNGERDDITFALDLRPVKESLREGLEASLRVDTPTLVGQWTGPVEPERIAALEADEESFENARLDLDEGEKAALQSEFETQVRDGNRSDNVTAALVALQTTVLDGLTGEMTFEEYNEQRQRDERALKAALADAAVANVADEPQLTGENPRGVFGGLASTTRWISRFAIVLPVVAVLLVVLAGWITRSFGRTARMAGVSSLLAGLFSVLVGFVLQAGFVGLYERTIAGSGGGFLDAFAAVIESLLATFGRQGLVLVAIAVVAIVLAAIDSRGYFDPLWSLFSSEEGATPPPGTAGHSNQQPPPTGPQQPPGREQPRNQQPPPSGPQRPPGREQPRNQQPPPTGPQRPPGQESPPDRRPPGRDTGGHSPNRPPDEREPEEQS